MKLALLAAIAASASAVQCTGEQINSLVTSIQGSVNAVPCTKAAGFSITEFILVPTLALDATTIATAAKNNNCKFLLQELQTAPKIPDCTWWDVPVATLVQLDLPSWAVTKKTYIASQGDATDTPATTSPKTTTKAPVVTTVPAANATNATTTVVPTTAAATPKPTNATNSTNTTTAAPTDIITTDIPFVLTREPTTVTPKPTTKAPTPAPSSAATAALSVVAFAVAAATLA
ncbi:Aste57867_22726 [Aphanomyces stellatus]|uniref:Aste57867_22726 protein n=1 Tax=Aphanomyces stellatus TaxID=120398 RepID=A0A485LLE2_9STRA|nr:hypothetical protein As57867_022656 [Aphanomyces stellatus]VFT99379.1 Aste57867_22726 [Aphanomyces stellatus]